MPIEISEIGVFVAIGDPAAAVPPRREEAGDPLSPERVEALVRACVHDVLRTLRMQEER